MTTGGQLALFFSDQADTCLNLTYANAGNPPRATVLTLSLRVAPRLDGTTRATVVAPKLAPGPGEAVGGIVQTTGGVDGAHLDASDGTVAWTLDATGNVTVTAADVGFAGASGRFTTGGLTLVPCTP